MTGAHSFQVFYDLFSLSSRVANIEYLKRVIFGTIPIFLRRRLNFGWKAISRSEIPAFLNESLKLKYDTYDSDG